jgi:hypothetical protein
VGVGVGVQVPPTFHNVGVAAGFQPAPTYAVCVTNAVYD